MEFLLPGFLGVLALAGLPLLLHLLRLQPRKHIPFPNLYFLGKAARRDSRRQSLRRWLLLLLRVLIIGGIVLAFCRPYWLFKHSSEKRAVVVIVDKSYSMQVPGRREAVKAWLDPLLAKLAAPDELGVLLLEESPTWLVPLGPDLEAARRSLTNWPVGNERTRLRPALELAAARLALSQAQVRQILVAGDGQALGWDSVDFSKPLPGEPRVFTPPSASEPRHQAAVLGLKAARLPGGRVGLEASVRLYSPQYDKRHLRFFAGKSLLGELDCDLATGLPQALRGHFALPEPDKEQALSVVLDADELPIDDVAYAALPAADDRLVLIEAQPAGKGPDFLREALDSVKGASLVHFQLDELKVSARLWPSSSILVLRGSELLGRAESLRTLETHISSGGSILLWCDGAAAQAAWLAKQGIRQRGFAVPFGEPARLRDLSLGHPLFEPFARHTLTSLLDPGFRLGVGLEGEDLEVLARWPDQSAAIAEQVLPGGGRLLLFGFSADKAGGGFSLEPVFLPLAHQALVHLSEQRRGVIPMLKVGQPQEVPGSGRWEALVSATPVPVRNLDGLVVEKVPGVYSFSHDKRRSLHVVNLDTTESDLRAWKGHDSLAKLGGGTSGKESQVSVSSGEEALRELRERALRDPSLVDEREVWWFLLAGAILLLMLELLLANRTVP